jgi:hypothetical protein
MGKKLIILSILVLIATSTYSQQSYPKKQLIGIDTVILITNSQLISINEKLIHRKSLIELIKTNEELINNLRNADTINQLHIKMLSDENIALIDVVKELDNSIISLKEDNSNFTNSNNKFKTYLKYSVGLNIITLLILVLI